MADQTNTSAGTAQAVQQERWFIERDPRPYMQWSRHVMRDADTTVCFMCHSDGADDAADEARAQLVASAPALAAEAQKLREQRDELLNVVAALTDFLDAQDALDNRELQGPNAPNYFSLLSSRNGARDDLDKAIAAAEVQGGGTVAQADPRDAEIQRLNAEVQALREQIKGMDIMAIAMEQRETGGSPFAAANEMHRAMYGSVFDPMDDGAAAEGK